MIASTRAHAHVYGMEPDSLSVIRMPLSVRVGKVKAKQRSDRQIDTPRSAVVVGGTRRSAVVLGMPHACIVAVAATARENSQSVRPRERGRHVGVAPPPQARAPCRASPRRRRGRAI